jgi:hypothetical protein
LIVDQGDVGSNPIRSANFNDPVGEWLSREAFNLEIAGSTPVGITTLGVAQPGQSPRLGSEMPQVQILPPRPNNGESSLMAKPQVVSLVNIGSSPLVHPTLAKLFSSITVNAPLS